MTNSFGEYLQKQIEYEKSKIKGTKHEKIIASARNVCAVLTEVQHYFEQYKKEEEARYNELLNKYNTLLGGLDKALHHLANEDTTDVYVVDAIHSDLIDLVKGALKQ
ncbi:hypothetical protein [Bacillus subtilis]|uniref:hypothetical protein n=1 Tax=Bacillus subtilis TaxID=1423 RepID=UPI0025CB6682|nr:hypothetical protein [Bacillus subtilis]WCS68098.1 hypothetical protein Goe26_01860 [Bacillus phage vB_BsuM-Goe26]GLI90457.1 hypothetical protein ANABIO4_38090 [Bacillus subtilis]